MGKALLIVAALFVGVAGFHAAQKYWLSAMMDRVDDTSSRQDWLPQPTQTVPTIDTSRMGRSIYSPVVVPATHR